MSTAFWFR